MEASHFSLGDDALGERILKSAAEGSLYLTRRSTHHVERGSVAPPKYCQRSSLERHFSREGLLEIEPQVRKRLGLLAQ
jgi:hypothetical protein